MSKKNAPDREDLIEEIPESLITPNADGTWHIYPQSQYSMVDAQDVDADTLAEAFHRHAHPTKADISRAGSLTITDIHRDDLEL